MPVRKKYPVFGRGPGGFPGGPTPYAPGSKTKPYTPPKITPMPSYQPSFQQGFPAYSMAAGPSPSYQAPNWEALIAGDPEWLSAQAEVDKTNRMERGSLRDAIRRAVVESGLEVGLDEDVDAGTIAAARANQYSSAAEIGNQLRRGSAQSDAELAARGILSSGQFTENRGVLQRAADTERNSLQNALLNTIATGRSAYTRGVNERQGMLRGVRESIANRLAMNPGLWQVGGGPATPGGGYADVFAPLANASARQMWELINSPSVRRQNAGIISRGYEDFLRNYGSQFGGGAGGNAPAAGGAATANAGTWAQLNSKYAGQIQASGNDPNGRPFVIVNGQKRYS